MIQENQGFPREGPWRGCGTLLTPGLTPLVIDMESATLVYTSDDLVVGAVEAVHADHTRLLLGVGIVRVGGIEIILKHSQAIQMLDQDALDDGLPALALVVYHLNVVQVGVSPVDKAADQVQCDAMRKHNLAID